MTESPDRRPEFDAGVMAAARTLWAYHALHMPVRPADAIVVLGSYDLRVAERGAELFRAAMAPRLVATGGFGNWTAGRFARPEAEVFADAMVAAGVPRARILVEPRATHIGENIGISREILEAGGVRRVIFVTKPQTQRRVLATAIVRWPEAEATVTAPPTTFEAQPIEGHSLFDLICEMVGDAYRIRDYPVRGWQAAQEMPEAVSAAAHRLAEAGFSAHLPGEAAAVRSGDGTRSNDADALAPDRK